MLLFLAVWITYLEKNLFLFFGYQLEYEFLCIVIINKIYKYECNKLVFIHQYPDKWSCYEKDFPTFFDTAGFSSYQFKKAKCYLFIYPLVSGTH